MVALAIGYSGKKDISFFIGKTQGWVAAEKWKN